MKKFLKIRYLFLLLLLWLVLRASLNYSGFCWTEKRWLSDEELKIEAIKRFIRTDDPELYLKNNPDCCHINEPPKFDWRKYNPNQPIEYIPGYSVYGDNWLNRLFGVYYKSVVVVNDDKKINDFESNNCGETFNN